jgi:hypothetical protein
MADKTRGSPEFKYWVRLSKLNLRSESADATPLKLTPHPQEIRISKGSVSFDANAILEFNLSTEFQFILDYLSTEIKQHLGKAVSYAQKKNEKLKTSELFESVINQLTDHQRANFLAEGYILEINKGTQICEILAENPSGIFYGIQTLFQLFNNISTEKECVAPACQILDFPDMILRSLSDDISRGQAATPEGIKKFIVELSRFKLNHYFLYIEDVVQIKKHPAIGVQRGALSKESIQELSAFAKKYFITISPIFESLGHMDNILSLKEYRHLAEFPGSDCLNISDPKSYDLLDDIYAELAEAFDSPDFHVACDESWEAGDYRSREYIQKLGAGRAYLDHYKKIYDLAKKHGKTRIFIYHDIACKFPEVLQGVPKDYHIVYWDYGRGKKGQFPKLDIIANAGFQFVVSPAVQDWSRLFPDLTLMEKNTENIIRYGFAKGAYGVIQSSWGDFRNENLRENRLYGFAFAPAMAWNIAKFSIDGFWDAFLLHFYGKHTPIINEALQFFRACHDQRLLGKKENFVSLWAHPFASPIISYKTQGYVEQREKLEKIIQNLQQIDNTIHRNPINVECIVYAAKLYKFFIQKTLMSEKLTQYDGEKFNTLAESEQQAIISQLAQLERDVKELKILYDKIWSASCSRDNLPPVLDQFDWLAQIFEEKREELADKKIDQNPNIPAEWIFFCPKKKKGEILHTYFRKDITLPEEFDKVMLQLICDTHCQVYLNGVMIDEFLSKRTLSVRMLNTLVKLIDLTSHCKPGTNVLVIHNMNYRGGIGVINAYGEIFSLGRRVKNFYSGKDWFATNIENTQWIAGNLSLLLPELKVSKVKSIGAPPMLNGALSYPNFDKKLPSHHTNILGFGNCEVLRFVPLKLVWLAKWLNKLAIKRGLMI